MFLVVGTNDALLEGMAQALASTGQRVAVAKTFDEAEDVARDEAPLLLIAERTQFGAADGSRLAQLPLAAGGAVVAYRLHGQSNNAVALPPALARLTLADLELPLERHRLVSLALYVVARAREAGRLGPTPTQDSSAS